MWDNLQQQLNQQNALIAQYKKALEGPQYDNQMGLLTVGGGINQYGMARPGTTLLRDSSGNLDPRFAQSLGTSYQALQDKALTQGDTEAARLAREQQGIMTEADRDNLRKMQDTGVAQGMRNLAMRGGASTGSRERLMRDANRQGLRGFQGIGRENRLANLQISQQDEAMKNQLLGQVGGAEQMIQDANTKMLAADIAQQNQALQNFYKEDMSAFGAKETAKAQRSASGGCFATGTKVRMANGDSKRIEDIRIGDVVYEGGKVYGVMQFVSEDMFDYEGVNVTGGHAVKEKEWLRVKDSEKAKIETGKFVVYNLCTENHLIIVDNIVFSDYDETSFGSSVSDEKSLEIMNGRLD